MHPSPRVAKRLRAVCPALLVASLFACGAPETDPPSEDQVSADVPESRASGPLFDERAAALGLDFVHSNGMSGELYLDEITCAGGAFADVDGDGDLDVYLAQGRMLPAERDIAEALVAPRHPVPLSDRLYRNQLVETGELRFVDATESAGIAAGGPAAATGYGCGAATGDFNGDGAVDLLVMNLGPNQLLQNRGDGTFEDVTAEADPDGALHAPRSTVAASAVDIDRDGDLDLFLANNLRFVHDDPPLCYDQTGARDYCGPGAYPPEPDQLLLNDGDGTFRDATTAAGLARSAGPALGSVAADFNGDGWPDLYVANDGQPNHLWISNGDPGPGAPPTFRDEGMLAGASVNAQGEPEASMGVDTADVDNDGDLDLFMTHLMRETNTLYLNDGTGLFADRTLASGLGAESIAFTSFGTAFFDVDNDGWLDLLIANGAVTKIPSLARQGDPFPLHQPNQLFRNLTGETGELRFREVTAKTDPPSGDAFAASEVSRGAVFGDVDNDGDADVLIVNNAGPVRLLLNRAGEERSWLGLRLVDAAAGRDLLGARAAILRDGGPILWRRAHTDGSYNASHDPRIVFGLGDDPAIDGVRVVWPDGLVETWPASAVEVGGYTTLVRGTGRRIEE